ncbi:MAG: hypothetical protein AVDCRST_MAG54-4445, partial [uncultured Actinomycetospora sp.]
AGTPGGRRVRPAHRAPGDPFPAPLGGDRQRGAPGRRPVRPARARGGVPAAEPGPGQPVLVRRAAGAAQDELQGQRVVGREGGGHRQAGDAHQGDLHPQRRHDAADQGHRPQFRAHPQRAPAGVRDDGHRVGRPDPGPQPHRLPARPRRGLRGDLRAGVRRQAPDPLVHAARIGVRRGPRPSPL